MIKNDKDANINNPRRFISEGILILLLTFLLYGLSYAYDFGYGIQFNIPPVFTSFSIQSLFYILPAVLITLLLSGFYALSSLSIFNLEIKGSKKYSTEMSILALNTLLLFIASYVLYTYKGIWWFPLIPAGLLLYVIIMHFVLPFILSRFRKTKVDILMNNYIEKNRKSEWLLKYLWNFAFYKTSMAIIVVLASFAIVINYGYSKASTKTSFYTYSETGHSANKKYIVVRFYDHKAILKDIQDNNLIGNQLKIIDLDSEGATFNFEKLGRLNFND